MGNQGPGQTVSSRSPQFKARAAPLPSVNTSTLARSDYSILPVRSVVSPKSVITDLWCIRRGEAVFYPPAGRSLGSRRRASGAGMPPLEAMTMDGASTSTAIDCHSASNIANRTTRSRRRLRPSSRQALGSLRPLRIIAPAPPRPWILAVAPRLSPRWNCQVDRPRPAVHRGRSPLVARRTC